MSITLTDAYVLAKAGRKVLADAESRLGAELGGEMGQLDVVTVKSEVGGRPLKVTLAEGRVTMDGFGEDFLDFMESQGMVTRAVLPEWKRYVEPVDGGKLVWKSTGEVVPGASWHKGTGYLTIRNFGDAADIIAAARESGALAEALPMLEGVDEYE